MSTMTSSPGCTLPYCGNTSLVLYCHWVLIMELSTSSEGGCTFIRRMAVVQWHTIIFSRAIEEGNVWWLFLQWLHLRNAFLKSVNFSVWLVYWYHWRWMAEKPQQTMGQIFPGDHWALCNLVHTVYNSWGKASSQLTSEDSPWDGLDSQIYPVSVTLVTLRS